MPDRSIDGTTRFKLWDPLLRGFHWLLALAVIACWGLGEWGPSVMTLHFWCGYLVVGLLAFRLIWGFVGPETARFASFLRGPSAVISYARNLGRRAPSNWRGHNPLGALAVVAMLALLAVQVASGLVSDPDDFINYGPLSDRVPSDVAADAVGWHHIGSKLILAMVLLHVGMILFYRVWKCEDLITPMVTGWKDETDPDGP